MANEYNPNVEGKNSAIFRKEKFLKAQQKGNTRNGVAVAQVNDIIYNQGSNNPDVFFIQSASLYRIYVVFMFQLTGSEHEIQVKIVVNRTNQTNPANENNDSTVFNNLPCNKCRIHAKKYIYANYVDLVNMKKDIV